ncbi:E3 ubiquitin-protein ligase [Gryllus bimaculatus]|nr:E3 ubiquitin-protein ligase [Gryllus bimaculatus]
MDGEEIVQRIFGKDTISLEQRNALCNSNTSSPPGSRKSMCLEVAKELIGSQLNEFGPSIDTVGLPPDTREGRIGPPVVRFDIATHSGLFVVGADRLSVNSQSNFSTIRANACLFKGKWQYELQLGSKGVMQVGWATNFCKFSQEIGVGDTANSYAYDGNRQRKWNVSTHKYGEPWLSGDVIGCTIDLNDGILVFYRNGRSLGEAFSNIQLGPGMAYFPSVSLAFTENLVANFGSTPMRYPVEGFLPIQDAPYKDLAKAELLSKWLNHLLELLLDTREGKSQSIGVTSEPMTDEALLLALAHTIIGHLAPLLLSPYITEACLMPFLESLCSNCQPKKGKDKSNRKLHLFLDLLWAFLEDFEIKKCLEHVVTHMLSDFRHVSFVLEYPHQKKTLSLLLCLVDHPQTRHHLLEHVLFDKVRFANFVHVKPLDEGGLAEVVHTSWWDSGKPDPSIDHKKSSYLRACKEIQRAIAEVENLQVQLLKALMNNTDGTATRPSSRKIFLRKFRTFLHENLISSRTMPLLQTPLPITLCCFHRLLVTFRELWAAEVDEQRLFIPTRTFYDGSINYYSIDRLGGVVSHLNKSLREDLVRELGPEHNVVAGTETNSNLHSVDPVSQLGATFLAGPSMNLSRSFEGPANLMIPVLARLLTQQQTSSGPLLVERITGVPPRLTEKNTAGPADPFASLIELLDGLILFYHVAAHKQIAKVSTLRESMHEYTTALESTRSRQDAVQQAASSSTAAEESNIDEILRELNQTCDVFTTKLSEQARHMAWVRAAVYSSEKQSQLAWLFRVVLTTMMEASKTDGLFSFVPEFYLETLVELCTALRTFLHPTAPIEDVKNADQLLMEMGKFLANHFADTRIVHANSKDTLIQSLATFVCSPNTLQALERCPVDSRMAMVRSLLRPYENRAWAQSNWVLVRIWQGCGFAFRYHKSPHLLRKMGPKLLHSDSNLISQSIKPCPSKLYQSHVKEIMLGDEPLATSFLNSLLNQLNWAFSEFIGMLQEIQNVSSRPERVFIESRQLKICATCFDLTLALLRVLEMVASVASPIFTDSSRVSADSLLARLCQLLCQVLNRVSSQAGCFQHVVTLEIPDLETVDHFPILAAVVGILLALLNKELKETNVKEDPIPKVSLALLLEPSFQLESLNFVLGNFHKDSKLRNKIFSFRNYTDDVNDKEIDSVQQMISFLTALSSRVTHAEVSEEQLCTICYAYPISATFKPCNHQSCRSCIAHHLMNSRDCFFCKTPIERVLSSEGEVLHELLQKDRLPVKAN